MSRILLDTSAYSALLRGHTTILEAVQCASEISLTHVVIGELLVGFRRGSREAQNRRLLDEFLASPPVRMLPIDDDTADRYSLILSGLLQIGKPIPTNDVWIAASAMQYGLALVTTDKHFDLVAQISAQIYPL
jgi:tRNA(fMet)-specific endonuclease VapC